MLEGYQKIAVVFPGQGSQTVGMLQELAANYAEIAGIYRNASAVLGYDLWQLTQEGPAEKLNQTEFTQPAMLVADVAVWQVCKDKFPTQPAFLAGHSLGEYSALVCAEAITFTDAVKLVAERAKLMQLAVPAGAGGMAAIIGLENSQILELCQAAAEGQVLAPANYNSLGQTVLAGELAAVERAVTMAKEHGAKLAKLLKVSVPSHCKLMKNAAAKLAQLLKNTPVSRPVIPVVNNTDLACYEDPDKIRDALVRQLYNPVRWVETIQFLAAEQVDCIIECGPGKVLAGLNKRITRDIPTLNCVDLY